MSNDLITVWRGASSERAESLRRMLEGRDVETFVAPCETEMGEWTVLAPAETAARARRFIEREEERAEEGHGEVDDDNILDDRMWRQWPACGECDAPRITRCQFCGSEGSDFPVADGGPSDGAQAILLCCGICDEPFEPEFYRHCAECGEDFGEGIETAMSGDPDLANPRVHMMLAGLVTISVLGFLYYLFLFR